MESISVFDIFKIGVGPSSSHTMGPWRAAQRFTHALKHRHDAAGNQLLDVTDRVRIELMGSLAKTGRGHGTDVAVLLGLSGEDPVSCPTEGIVQRAQRILTGNILTIDNARTIPFSRSTDLIFNFARVHPGHPNALTFTAFAHGAAIFEQTYFSVGGGFVIEDVQENAPTPHNLPLPFTADNAATLQTFCDAHSKSIPQIVMANEHAWRTRDEIRAGILNLWHVMEDCIFRGCQTEGTLPGGLNVTRRAPGISRRLLANARPPVSLAEWKRDVARSERSFDAILKWVSCFALAVNEENASFGRVVTAPTNGAAGVIPAVLMYHDLFHTSNDDAIIDFVLTAAQIGVFFKKGATISAAMGGCQAEIGVSSAMAAAGLAQVSGATPAQVLMAAEIAMEHHLGMTCDPIGGLVQIPCIERNTMGAVKAITAANIAIESDPALAKVSLDGVIKTMWDTAQDMQTKYKETAEGGLALTIPVTISEC